jgi:hypothetical protein
MPNLANVKSQPLPPKALIGMVHVGATPGAPFSQRSIAELSSAAAKDAVALANAGFDAVLIENMHDTPYETGIQPPQVVSAMTAVGLRVQDALAPFRKRGRTLPLGVQVLAAGNREALAVALAVGAAFIRCENFVFAHVADEGLMATAHAGPLLRYRRSIGAEHVAVFADIKKKHAAHALTADVSVHDAAHAALFFAADGLIVTGVSTGRPAQASDVGDVVAAAKGAVPVLVGSGVSPATLRPTLDACDGVIVGSTLKQGGRWQAELEPKRLRGFVKAAGRG